MPHKDIEAIIDVLGQSPDEKLKECWKAWRVRSYSPTNYAWATEWWIYRAFRLKNKLSCPRIAAIAIAPPDKPKAGSISREEF